MYVEFKKFILLLFPIFVFSFSINAREALSKRYTNYEMDIYLDIEKKMLLGKTTLVFKNPSPDVIEELQFHMYYNAFKNTRTTFMKNNDFPFFRDKKSDECVWGYTDILTMKDEKGRELINEAQYISPDDNNPYDQTVLKVPLIDFLEAGDSIIVKFEWEAKIPKRMPRTGYNKDFYFFAQWFPKLGVYEAAGMRYQKKGAWNCHQYHATGEYYGEFGNYKVNLDVPIDFVVAASGEKTKEIDLETRKQYTFEVNDVIDFCWTASPYYEMIEQKWNDVSIKLYKYPGHKKYVERYFQSAINTLEYLDDNVGKYPYPTLTIIDPPIHGLFTGGMEYPTLITSISLSFIPKGLKAPETLVVHEIIHQYFMQMLATHEQEEPWMDEGITTYYESKILDHYYGSSASFGSVMGISLGNGEYNRIEFWQSPNPKIADNTYKAREFIHGGYGVIAYNKVAMFLKTLENIIGQEEMNKAMKAYFEKWKFDHPSGADFVASLKENIDRKILRDNQLNLNTFINQALFGTELCDFAVANIENTVVKPDKGFLENNQECFQESQLDGTLFESRVIIHRLGELIVPIEIKVNFDDGSSTLFIWDGRKRSTEFSSVDRLKISSVQLDPEFKLNLEKNLFNNSLTVKNNKSYKIYSSRFKIGLQHVLDFLNILS